MAPKPSDPLGILSKKCQVWWKTVTAAAPAPALGRPPRGPPGVSRCKCRGERVPRRPDCAGPQDQQWKLGRVNGYERSRNCYTIEYNGGFKEIDLVVVKHKEEDGECSPQSLCPPKHACLCRWEGLRPSLLRSLSAGMVQITKSYLLRFDPKDHTAKVTRGRQGTQRARRVCWPACMRHPGQGSAKLHRKSLRMQLEL